MNPANDNGTIAEAVRFDKVSKSFRGRQVLREISFNVHAGEALCVLGRSGTGKSVTLKLMIGLLTADSGQVFIKDKDMATISREELAQVRRKMGFLFQSAALFDSFSIADNLALPLHRLDSNRSPAEIAKAVDKALGQVGLGQDKNKLPAELSGGMRKRAGLARALVLEPEILLIDEPSSGLDPLTASEIDELLLQVKREQHTTMVIVTHDMRGARSVGDRFAVLDNGDLAALGTLEELGKSDNQLVRQFLLES